MTSSTPSNDYALAYDQAIIALHGDADNAELKHQAVLALARAGSLDFALAEYKRYGLDDIRHHEDIMALGARLLKDLYLVNTGAKAKEFAQDSAQKYEAAFQDTQGYYSGINAATMSLLADVPGEIVQGRAQAILEKLPSPDDLDKESLYYIVATRAEAQLLLGDRIACVTALRRAVDHDPLNYTAHATTLKQFRMILQKREEGADWLRAFAPPKSIHFAGHMFGAVGETKADLPALSQAQIGALQIEISDTLQREDIGFGYGALAAGADILCAQALLEEGGELHVVLPVGQKVFLEKSVAPFGDVWVDRFHECLAQAASVRYVTGSDIWPNSALNCHAGQIAMGGAVMKAESLSVMPAQLLIWDGRSGETGTAKHAQDWQASDRAQISINYPGKRNAKSPLFSEKPHLWSLPLLWPKPEAPKRKLMRTRAKPLLLFLICGAALKRQCGPDCTSDMLRMIIWPLRQNLLRSVLCPAVFW